MRPPDGVLPRVLEWSYVGQSSQSTEYGDTYHSLVLFPRKCLIDILDELLGQIAQRRDPRPCRSNVSAVFCRDVRPARRFTEMRRHHSPYPPSSAS